MLPTTADVSVRPAIPGDEVRIARIQLAAWRTSHAEVLGEVVLDSLDEAAFVERWQAAVTAPPGPGFHVLVACDGPRVVGFVSLAPVPAPEPLEAPGGLVLALEVDPPDQRAGHGSRLLQAAVDTLAADRFTRAVTWVNAGDDALRTFLTDAGWAPDTAHRELDLDGTGATTVKQVRLHTAIG